MPDAKAPRLTFPTKLGFGASGLGTLYRDVSEREAEAVFQEAYDAGWRYFDTAPLYGHGLSELRLGHFLRTIPRASVTVSTKAGRYMVPPRGESVNYGYWAAPLRLKPVFDYSYDGTLRSIEQSANRIGITDFDLVYIHDVDRFTHGDSFERRFDEAVDGCYRALADLRKGGFIKAVGVGVNESDIATRFVEACDLDVVMMAGRYTLLERGAMVDLFPAAKMAGTQIVAAGVFNSGILAAGPDSAKATYDYGAPPADVVAKVRRLQEICRAEGVPLQAAAVQFPLRHPQVSAAVLGMSRIGRVAQNMEWFNWPISEALWADLDDAVATAIK
ncbi:MAG: aldo/keto reductase [Ancalomicrobiaceae bacterium]|nr:aldo/keto reductase [Ancalomicrobiaceae bacterium]